MTEETNKETKNYNNLKNKICRRKNIYPEQKYKITNVTPAQNEENMNYVAITLSRYAETVTNETIPISFENFQKEFEILQ